MSSTNFVFSPEVNFKASAAILYSQLFHKIEEQDSGELPSVF
jgi:hypothetical protein